MKTTSAVLMLAAAVTISALAVPKANAGVVVGISVGAPVAPVYVAPAPAYEYVAPAYVAPVYLAPAPYVAVRPLVPFVPRVYVAPGALYRRGYVPGVVVRRDRYDWRR